MKDIFDSADWAREALAKKEAEKACLSPSGVKWFKYEFNDLQIFEIEERKGEGLLVLDSLTP